jgi:hypothetical protein
VGVGSIPDVGVNVGVGVAVGVGDGTVNSNVTQSGLCDESLTELGVFGPINDVMYGGDVCMEYNSPFVVGI